MEITNIKNYGDDRDKITVETVGNFINMMNFLNFVSEKTVINGKKIEIEKIQFDFVKCREFILLKNQIIKIFLEGKEVEKTDENICIFLNKHKNVFYEIIKDITENSIDVGFIIKNKFI